MQIEAISFGAYRIEGFGLLFGGTSTVYIMVQVDDHPEVLDVAAVEAALSFCEENDDPQSLPGPWEHPIQQERDKPVSLPAPEMTVKQERLDFEETLFFDRIDDHGDFAAIHGNSHSMWIPHSLHGDTSVRLTH